MPIEGKKLYLGGEPIQLIQNNGFVHVDPLATPEPEYQYIRTDFYSGSVVIAMPGTYFSNGFDFTMSDAWSDISGDINPSTTSKTITPTTGGDTGNYYISESLSYFTDEGYTTSMITTGSAAAAVLDASDLPFGSNDLVVEAWICPVTQQLTRPPFHSPVLRSNEPTGDFYLDISANNTYTANASRVRILENSSFYFSDASALSFSLGTWMHMAYVRNGSNWYVYKNGSQIFTFSDASSIPSPAEGFALMGYTVTNTNNENAGWAYSDYRVTIGSDRGYVGGFTPPPSILTTVKQDADAAEFISTAGIVDGTQQDALNELVTDLKSAGIWTKMVAVYPFVGGTATTHKYNLKNPVDSDAAFRLTFGAGVSHSSAGMTPNGANNASGFTHIRVDTQLSQNDVYCGIYIGTNVAEDRPDFGAISGGNGIQAATRLAANGFSTKLFDTTNDVTTSTDSRGFSQISRLSSTGYYQQKDSDYQTFITRTSATPPTNEYMAIGGIGTAETTSTSVSTKTVSFAVFGQGLSTTEMDDFYTAVQTFQTTLGRNV